MINEEHAVMFGGSTRHSGCYADVYVLHLPTMVSDLSHCLSVMFKKLLDISDTAHDS